LLDYVRSNGHLDKVEYLAEGILATIHIRYSHFKPLQPFVVQAKTDPPSPA